MTLRTVAEAVVAARHIVVLTGAGVSAESGIPTFRDAMTGLWAAFDPRQLATPEAFAEDPARVTQWYDQRRLACLDARPNPAHLALAALQQRQGAHGRRFTLLTQNVDGLHQAAGSTDVIELHGTILHWRCTRTGRQQECRGPAFAEYPPKSEAGGLLRPAVVWFGEMLPEEAVAAADQAVYDCDLFLSVGTSAVVYPAAGYCALAAEVGAVTVEVNLEPTPISTMVSHSLRGPAGSTLQSLLREVEAISS